MNKIFQYVLALGVATVSFSSCGRADYAFKSNAPAYLHSEHVRPQVKAPTIVSAPQKETAISEVTVAPIAAPVVAQPQRTATVIAPKAQQVAARPSLVQKLIVKRVVKQLVKNNQQNTASTTETASKAGRAAIVAGVGLLLLLLGGAAEIGIIAIIGLIAFIVGIVLLIVGLVNGE